ncbi:hypothetical protein DIPPA_18473 [Diplonema papillatum]|nr:hypothetical protein DIPPA_18473 [Diplonema papillatum]|eukprot:gene15034-22948_t
MLFQRPRGDDLFALGSEEYLERFNVKSYLNDVVQQLLDSRDERPLDFLSEYFLSVSKGTHVVARPYSFVLSTQHNRASAGFLMRTVFPEADFRPPVTLQDFLQLVLLLCPEFPTDKVRKVYDVVAEAQGSAGPGLPLLMQAMSCRVYYTEFFDQLAEILLTPDGVVSKRAVVVDVACVLTSSVRHPRSEPLPATHSEGGENPGGGAGSPYGKEWTVMPAKEHINSSLEKAAARSHAAGVRLSEQAAPGAGSVAVSVDFFVFELLASPHFLSVVSAAHPSLQSLYSKGIHAVTESILSAHEVMTASGRRRKAKPSKDSQASTR